MADNKITYQFKTEPSQFKLEIRKVIKTDEPDREHFMGSISLITEESDPWIKVICYTTGYSLKSVFIRLVEQLEEYNENNNSSK